MESLFQNLLMNETTIWIHSIMLRLWIHSFLLLTIWSLLGLRIVRQPLRFENFWKSPIKKQVKLKILDWVTSHLTKEYGFFKMDLMKVFIIYILGSSFFFSELVSLGKKIINEKMVGKFLRSLPRAWEPKVTTIKEAKNL